MKVLTRKWFQLFSVFLVGILLGVWQYIPAGESSAKSPSSTANKLISDSEFNEKAFIDTAKIGPLLNLKAPEKSAPVSEWYQFALSFDDMDLGKRTGNSGQTSPMLAWYAYIAKHKPEALYKLYNQGKLGRTKFEHLLRFGYLKYWDESINDVDKVLLHNRQAVLTMAYSKGKAQARKRVEQAFLKLSNDQMGENRRDHLTIEILLFAMKGMSDKDKDRVLPILKSGVFIIDPREFYHLKIANRFEDADIVSLIDQTVKNGKNGNSYRQRMMSGYMMDGALLGNQDYIKSMMRDLEDNAKQPTNFYCAACGLALSTDGLLGYPLINASKKGKLVFNKDQNGVTILSRKAAW